MESFLLSFFRFSRQQALALVTLILGLFVYFAWVASKTEVQAFPEFTNVQVRIITQFPGKAPEEVERFVTRPLETLTNGLPGLMGSRSLSLFGLSIITLTFNDQTQAAQARLNTQIRIQEAQLPPGAEANLEPDATPLGEIYRYVIKGPLPADELRLIQDWDVRRELKSVPGVADVISFGGPLRTVSIRLDPKEMWDLNLSIDEVSKKLAENNLNSGGGFIQRGQQAYLVRTLGLYSSLDKLREAIIASRGGAPIRLKDIGDVEYGYVPRLGQVGLNDEPDAVQGIVLMRRGEDAKKTVNRVKQALVELSQSLPKGVTIIPVYDRTELIDKSMHTVAHNIVVGILLVALILGLGLGIKQWAMTLAVLLIIPFSLLAAIYTVVNLGYTPNLISLGAVDFGIIVETAILAAETLIAYAALSGQEHLSDQEMAQQLSRVLAPALICALVLIVAFIPILSLEQVEGRIFKPLGITLVGAVIGGQLGALIFVPAFSRWLPKGTSAQTSTWIHHAGQVFIEKLLWVGQKILRILPWPKLTLGSLLIASTILLAVNAGKEFLPELNEGNIYIRMRAPSTIALEESAQLANQVRAQIAQFPEVIHVLSQAGRPDDGTESAGFDNVEFLVTLKPLEVWTSAHNLAELVSLVQKKLETQFVGVEFQFSQYIKDNIDEAISGVTAFEAIRKKGFGILLSNAVAIFGLIPSATSHGIGAEISRPFAVMIVGGLCSSLLLSLILYSPFLDSRPKA